MAHEVLCGMYQIRNTIGSGGFAKVKLAYHCATGDKVAIKIMNKKALGKDLPRIKIEIEALKALNHTNVCGLYQVHETDENFYLVLEHCQGGELFDYIVAKDKLTEKEARGVFRQIVSAVAYIHNQGFVHRDLKPENILLDEEQNVKLIDFGLCARPEGGLAAALSTCCGSPAYAAPELLLGNSYIASQVDLWSMGVLLYTLLCGYLPFDDKSLSSLYKKILAGKYHCPKWLSKESSDLLKGLLQFHPNKRFTIREVAAHPWVSLGYDYPIECNLRFRPNVLDDACVTQMSIYYGLQKPDIQAKIMEWNYDYVTSTYFLLLRKKERGRPVRLIRSLPPTINHPEGDEVRTPLKTPSNKMRQLTDSTNRQNQQNNESAGDYEAVEAVKPKCAQPLCFDTPEVKRKTYPNDGLKVNKREEVVPKEEKKENFLFRRPQTPKAKHRPITNHIPAITIVDGGKKTPVKTKMTPVPHVGTPRPPRTPKMDHYMPQASVLSPSRSIDSQLHNLSVNEETYLAEPIIEAPSPSRSKTSRMAASMFGSLEKGMDMLKVMLTPKKKSAPEPPRTVKSEMHVSNICQMSPEELIVIIQASLNNTGVSHKRKGYFIICKKTRGKEKLKFEMEIVAIRSGYIGISRKRIEGDSWFYKSLFEDILRQIRLK